MRILHVIINLTAGGAELMLKRLTAAQSADPRFEHEVVSLVELGSVGPMLQRQGVPVTSLGMSGILDVPRVVHRLVSLMRRREPDIVHCWMYHADLLGGLAARLAGVKSVIWSVRISDIGQHMGIPRSTGWIRSACARLSAKIPDAIVYVAQSARVIHEQLGYDRSRSLVIPNGYEVGPTGDRQTLRRGIGASEDTILIGSAGRFSAQKDPRTFVEAAAMVASQCPQAHFVMIGRGHTPMNSALASWLCESGVSNRFHLLGERQDLPVLLGGLDLFCLHSIGEGFPNVVAEAMMAGVPCVVTDVGDAPVLVAETGLVVPPADPRAIADALISLANLSKRQREQLGAAARQRIATHYSIEVISRRYTDLYLDLARVSKVGRVELDQVIV